MLNRHNLAIATLTNKEESRYLLSKIRITPAYTEATNGYVMMRVSTPEARENEFDAITQLHTDAQPTREFTPFLIGRDAALSIVKSLPKRAKFPVQAQIAVASKSNDNGHAYLAVTPDLDRPQEVRVKKEEGSFPDVDLVIPKPEAATVSIHFNLKVLLPLLKQLESFCDDSHRAIVTFGIKDANSQMRIDATNHKTGQTAIGVVMPYRK